MTRLVIKNHEGDEIAPAHAVVLLGLVLPGNLLIATYLSMLLAGALHSCLPQFPALGFWSAACAVLLFRVLGWTTGPFAFRAPPR
jgi:hypothetical protein